MTLAHISFYALAFDLLEVVDGFERALDDLTIRQIHIVDEDGREVSTEPGPPSDQDPERARLPWIGSSPWLLLTAVSFVIWSALLARLSGQRFPRGQA